MQAGFREECREDKRHFFKIITNGSAKRLRIPPAFLEHINASSHHAILKGPSNNIWRVEVKQIRHGTIFMKGWKRFHRDHCIEFGDFLVFGYDGNMHFSVHIFDRSACEKESAFHVKNSKEISHRQNVRWELKVETTCEQHPGHQNIRKENQKNKLNAPLRRGVISQRRAITDEEIGRVLAAASSFRSDRPYCRIVMAPSHVYFGFFMRVPSKFRDYLPSTASDLTLWDPNGKPWPVRYVCLRRYGALSGGWGKFTLHHNIEEGDICIFELIKEKELKVHIFRVVEEIVPPQRKRSIHNHCFVS